MDKRYKDALSTDLRATAYQSELSLVRRKVGRLYLKHFELRYDFDHRRMRTYYHAVCDCGLEKVVSSYDVLKGKIQSCGCLGKEIRLKALTKTGHSATGKKTKEYRAWEHMIKRGKPGYKHSKDYYDRGIRVADVFHDYSAFLAYVGKCPSPSHSIDRINNNGNYEPGNIRWATPKEQNSNKRNNTIIEFNGESKTLTEWARVFKLAQTTVSNRLRLGWPTEYLFIQPSVSNRRKYSSKFYKNDI